MISVSTKILVGGIIILLLGSANVLTYVKGVSTGSKEVLDQWNQAKQKQLDEYLKQQQEYDHLVATLRVENQTLTDTLAEKEKAYEVSMVIIRADHAKRLQLSEQRTNYYQRQAKGSTIEQANLASHAARLDRSLEEGRLVARELSATVRQRDDQLRVLGQQLINDRKLLTLEPTP